MQTLYYLGPAGTGRRKRTAAAAAQQGTVTGAEAGAADAAAEPEEAAGSKKGGKRGKRRKKGPADAGKENNVPEEEPAAPQKSSSQLPADPEVGGNAGSCLAFWLDRDPTARHCGGACHHSLSIMHLCFGLQEDFMPEGEVVLAVENKSPLHETFQFQRVSGGLTR